MAAGEGQDFIEDHSDPNIDFATIHSWVDNWAVRLCCSTFASACSSLACMHRHLVCASVRATPDSHAIHACHPLAGRG